MGLSLQAGGNLHRPQGATRNRARLGSRALTPSFLSLRPRRFQFTPHEGWRAIRGEHRYGTPRARPARAEAEDCLSETETRPVIVATPGDLHTNSTLGLCPSEGVDLDDGGHYAPNKIQRWIWQCWCDYWAAIGKAREALGAELWVAINGEVTD